MITHVYNPVTGTFTTVNDEPKKTPTLEDCQKLLTTSKGYDPGWHIAVFPHSVRIYSGTQFVSSFTSVADLHKWLTERQPSKTVTVEILREDAETVAAMSSQDVLVSRFTKACKKALEA